VPSLVGLEFHPPLGQPKTLSFFVCMSIMLLNDGVSAYDFAMKLFDYRNNFDTVGQGKVCACALTFNFLCTPPNGDNTKCRTPKTHKIWSFSPPNGV